MHTLRVTTVNASFLAFCSLSRAVSTAVVEMASPDPRKAPSLIPSAMSISLPQFLRRTPVPALPAALYATRTRFAAFEPIVRAAFAYGLVHPWRALAAFAPEKVFSDLIKAVLGAIYIHTNGDLKACMAILRRFGVLGWVETALKNNDEIRRPKEEVDRLARHKKVRYHVWIEDVDDHDPGPMEELVDTGSSALLLVAMLKTPGHSDRPNVEREAKPSQSALQGFIAIKLHELQPVYHGHADPRSPFRSDLLLWGDGPEKLFDEDMRNSKLTVETMSSINTERPSLAFLSACCTAENAVSVLMDEGIHLAGAFRLAGYPHVIASLWEADDALSEWPSPRNPT